MNCCCCPLFCNCDDSFLIACFLGYVQWLGLRQRRPFCGRGANCAAISQTINCGTRQTGARGQIITENGNETNWTLFFNSKKRRGVFPKPPFRIPNCLIHLHIHLSTSLSTTRFCYRPILWQSPAHLCPHHHYLHKRALLDKTFRKKHHQTLESPTQSHAESHPALAQSHQNPWTLTPLPTFFVIAQSHLPCRPAIKYARLYNKQQVLISFATKLPTGYTHVSSSTSLHCQSFDQFLPSSSLAT